MIVSMKNKSTKAVETIENVFILKHNENDELTIEKNDGNNNTYNLKNWSIFKVLDNVNIKTLEINYVGQVLFTQCPICGNNIAQSMTHKHSNFCEHCGLELDLKKEYISRNY